MLSKHIMKLSGLCNPTAVVVPGHHLRAVKDTGPFVQHGAGTQAWGSGKPASSSNHIRRLVQQQQHASQLKFAEQVGAGAQLVNANRYDKRRHIGIKTDAGRLNNTAIDT
jgi:hypothetical protein